MSRTEFSSTIRTRASLELVNVTAELERAVRESGVESGIALAFVPHATCALLLNEDESGLREDMLRLVREVIEPLRRKAPFAHDRIDDNAAAHLGSILLGPSLSIPVSGGRPVLGTWQQLFLVELDGPRSRTLRVVVR
ncbi:MAG TPA: secondary thiamine-phosphate synthase enzyme YjbQ [Terriglobales bacterium]|nr:secondary thiamine-phosphate synthase enzyme YjbQ [Terriglobales bacterium]